MPGQEANGAVTSCARVQNTLVVNSRIATMNKRQPFGSALAIKDGTIIGAGFETELNHLRGPKTAVIDAGAAT